MCGVGWLGMPALAHSRGLCAMCLLLPSPMLNRPPPSCLKQA
jgi:hypothetical protein